jgi:AAA+ ATPase superfamily predicted ATPase
MSLIYAETKIIPFGIIPFGIIPFGIIFTKNSATQGMSKDRKGPFMFGKTVSESSFTNREKEYKKLKTNLLSGINTILISPRRWGKSSLVEKLMNDFRQNETAIRVVQLDFFGIHSEGEFLTAFAGAVIKASSDKWEEWMSNATGFFKQLIPRLSVGIDPQNDFSMSFDWNELIKNKDEILNLPETISAKKGIRMVICLDEFQNISAYPGYKALEKHMRTCWQRHKLVSYCLLGSKRHMMSDIFNNPGKPFYRFGDIMFLGKIEEKSWLPFIISGFESTGKSIKPEAARRITELMACHSWYVQQLSHYTWNRTGKKAGMEEVEAALEEVLETNMPLYLMETEWLSATQLQFLIAIAHGETRLTSQSVMKKYQLGTPRNILKNKKLLLDHDIIDLLEGKYIFLDPAFEIWFRRIFVRRS